MHIDGMISSGLFVPLGLVSCSKCFLQKTSLLMVLKPPPPPPPPDGPQLPGGLLSSEPLGLKEQEDDGAWRAWVRALSSCSYRQHGGKRNVSALDHFLRVKGTKIYEYAK